jgi:hypothetical protein
MRFLQKLLNKFNGLYYPQEYLCLAQESFYQPLYAYCIQDGKITKDITQLHCFVGYCPLIFALPFAANVWQEQIDIAFTTVPKQLNELLSHKDALATLSFKKIHQQNITNDAIAYYEGHRGHHRFISSFHQCINSINNRLHGQKLGNIFLKGNLHKQVQIAYAIPRKISLITVANQNKYNHFPTDLHGQISDEHYIISLRHAGAACKQVEAAQKIVLSDMQSSTYKQVYSLGKNHMQPLKEYSAFDFGDQLSKCLQLPLPKNKHSYKELVLESSFIHGIHRLLLFKIMHREPVNPEYKTLAHLHNTYATWRHKKGLAGNYLLR